MLLDLSELVIRDGLKSDVEVDQPSVPDPDLDFVEPVTGEFQFENSGDLINITGVVRTVVRVPCGRCLTDVEIPIDTQIDERFPIEEVKNPKAIPEDHLESLVPTVVHLEQTRPILDMDELIRQHLVTELPIAAVCDDACKGLCPTCGANLNEGPCACPTDTTDSPLAVLGKLLEKDNGGAA